MKNCTSMRRVIISAFGITAVSGLVAPQTHAALTLLDNFNTYNNDTIQTIGANGGGDATGGVWDGVFDGTANARIFNDPAQDDGGSSDNMLEVYGTGTLWRGAEANLATAFGSDRSIPNGDTASTLFLQFQVKDPGANNMDSVWGLAQDVAAISESSPWNDFAIMGVVGGPNNTNIDFRVHDGPANSSPEADVLIIDNLAMNTWYNVWFVINESAQTFEVFTSTGSNPAVSGGTYDFGRYVNPAGLAAIGFTELVSSSGENHDAALRIDNIYMGSGAFTNNPLIPEPGSLAMIGIAAMSMLRGRRRSSSMM